MTANSYRNLRAPTAIAVGAVYIPLTANYAANTASDLPKIVLS